MIKNSSSFNNQKCCIEIIVLYIFVAHDNTKGYIFILRNMKEMEMYYVNIQKESFDKVADVVLFEGA